ncbi:MAG: hypothetical protein WCJ64_20975 [Rhodospirillaceae bacterium]
MTSEISTFYAGFPSDIKDTLEGLAIRWEAETKIEEIAFETAIQAVMRKGRILSEARELFGKNNNKYGEWVKWRLPGTHRDTALNYRSLWETYGVEGLRNGSATPLLEKIGLKGLYALSAPSTPEPVRQEIERRAIEGGDTSVAEIARLKAEHKAALDAKAKEVADAKALVAAKDRIINAGSANERRAMDERDAAQKQADDAKAKLAEARNAVAEAKADKARALADKDEAKAKAAELAEKAAEEAWQEADEKYETIVNRLTREAAEAKQKTQAAELAAAQAKAAVQVEAQKLAETMADDVLKGRKKEVSELEANYKRVQANAANAHAAAETAKRELVVTQEAIKTHEAEMARWASGEAETADQIKLAVDLSEAVGVAMSEIGMLEHGPQPAAIPKLQIASQRCRQMADALDAFLVCGSGVSL